ncbi:hypothetical protein EWB00_000595, partial [Schistosoma japonicum]
ILYTDIHYIRRPTYMSTSINQLGCKHLSKNNNSFIISSSSSIITSTSTMLHNNKHNIGIRPNVSAPVTRKFVYNENLPKYRVEKYFELVLHNKKVYRLRGITSEETTKWINLIKNMLRINEAEQILNKYKSQIIKEGWLKRIKKGQITWLWCRLAGFYLIYSLNPQSTIPIGCKNLRNTYIHLIGNHASSLERGITKQQNRSYQQVMNTVEECEQWRDCLLRASLYSSSKLINSMNIQKSTLSLSLSSSSSPICTSLSSFKLFQIIQKIWRQLVNPSHYNNLYHSTILIKEPISKILLNNEQIQLSLRLFNHLLFLCYPQLNCTHKLTLQSINITLNNLMLTSKWLIIKYLIVKQIIEFCYNNPMLKDELYLQLIKQIIFSDQLNIDFNIQIGKQYKESLNEVNAQLTTSFLNKLIIPIININQRQRIDNWWPAIAIWECLCICLTYMLPSEPIIECLQYVFMLYMNSIRLTSIESNEIITNDKIKLDSIQMKRKFYTEISSYATFCYDTLKRIKLYGGREQTPSILEIFTISIRNPHTHVYPFSLPIYLPFGSNYEIVNFHGNSTIYDLQLQMIEKLNLNNITYQNVTLFAIYLCLGETINQSKHIYLNPQWKILHQLHSNILTNFYQIPIMYGIDFIDLIVYLCYADYYDYSKLFNYHYEQQITFHDIIKDYLPNQWLNDMYIINSQTFSHIKLLILDRWTKLSEYATKDHLKKCNYGDERDFATYFACLNYLKHLKCLFPYRFNCSAYIARVHNLSLINENQLIWIIPQDEKINILTGGLFELSSNFELLKTINITELKQISCIKSILFKNIISYGGQQNGIFFLVTIDKANNKNIINDNHLKRNLLADPATSESLDHNLHYNNQLIGLTSCSSDRSIGKKKNLNSAIVAHLHQLELRNQKLEKEKVSLEHQLAHILKRLTVDQNKVCNNKQRSDVNQSEQLFTTGKKNNDQNDGKSLITSAPIAYYDVDDAIDRKSLLESNGAISLGEYSNDKNKFNNQMSNSTIRGSNLSEISNPDTHDSNTSQLQNQKLMNSLNKEGPPKVHISRKYLYEPKEYLQFSDTSSSINQIEKNDDISLKNISYTTNNESFTFNDNQLIKYQLILKFLLKFIKSIEVFTCISGYSYLLQNITLDTTDLIPILIQSNKILSIDYDQSSETNSENSLHQLIHFNQLLINSYKINDLSIKSINQLKNLSNELYNIETITLNETCTLHHMNSIETMNNVLNVNVTNNNNNKLLLLLHNENYSGVLLKLNNHLKIWHHYWCILTLKVILYTDIHNIRRPTYMSTSINQLGCKHLSKNNNSFIISSSSSIITSYINNVA